MGKPTTVHSARKGNLWPYTKVRKSGGKVKDPEYWNRLLSGGLRLLRRLVAHAFE